LTARCARRRRGDECLPPLAGGGEAVLLIWRRTLPPRALPVRSPLRHVATGRPVSRGIPQIPAARQIARSGSTPRKGSEPEPGPTHRRGGAAPGDGQARPEPRLRRRPDAAPPGRLTRFVEGVNRFARVSRRRLEVLREWNPRAQLRDADRRRLSSGLGQPPAAGGGHPAALPRPGRGAGNGADPGQVVLDLASLAGLGPWRSGRGPHR
jgi:hypothetical protein